VKPGFYFYRSGKIHFAKRTGKIKTKDVSHSGFVLIKHPFEGST
jgi:hypothetical protein